MPVRPTRQNRRKRAETAPSVSFDVTSAAKSSAILLSSLLSPYCRSRKAEGSSTVRRRPRAVAKISSRILKPCEEIAGATLFERVAPDHEMAAHRIGEVDAEKEAHQRVRPAAHARTLLRQPRGRAAIEVAAGDGNVGAAGAQAFEHVGEHGLVMLQVGVHDRQVARLAREHPLEAGAGETAAADAANAAHAAVGFADRARGRRAPVRRIVVDEYHLPIVAGENAAEPRDQDRNVGLFVEGRHDDREFRRRPYHPALVRARKRGRRARRRSPVYRRLRQVSALHATRIVALCVGAGY